MGILSDRVVLIVNDLVVGSARDVVFYDCPVFDKTPSENRPPRKHDRNVKQRVINRAPKHTGYY